MKRAGKTHTKLGNTELERVCPHVAVTVSDAQHDSDEGRRQVGTGAALQGRANPPVHTDNFTNRESLGRAWTKGNRATVSPLAAFDSEHQLPT